MKIGPKYKIARRLGADVFEKTQTHKFALALQKRPKVFSRRPRSGYGIQLLEKQKVRFTYILSEKQFVRYIKKVIAKNISNPSDMLYKLLEKRLDNAVLRSGFAATRPAARQMVSHGHIQVNGKKVTISSYEVKVGDKITIKEKSLAKPLCENLDDRLDDHTAPAWISFDKVKKEATIKSEPVYNPTGTHFDLLPVLQFYKR